MNIYHVCRVRKMLATVGSHKWESIYHKSHCCVSTEHFSSLNCNKIHVKAFLAAKNCVSSTWPGWSGTRAAWKCSDTFGSPAAVTIYKKSHEKLLSSIVNHVKRCFTTDFHENLARSCLTRLIRAQFENWYSPRCNSESLEDPLKSCKLSWHTQSPREAADDEWRLNFRLHSPELRNFDGRTRDETHACELFMAKSSWFEAITPRCSVSWGRLTRDRLRGRIYCSSLISRYVGA